METYCNICRNVGILDDAGLCVACSDSITDSGPLPKAKDAHRRNYLANRPARLAYQRAYSQKHKPEAATYQREYLQTHKPEINATARRRYARNKALT